jgi:hypothetical protein
MHYDHRRQNIAQGRARPRAARPEGEGAGGASSLPSIVFPYDPATSPRHFYAGPRTRPSQRWYRNHFCALWTAAPENAAVLGVLVVPFPCFCPAVASVPCRRFVLALVCVFAVILSEVSRGFIARAAVKDPVPSTPPIYRPRLSLDVLGFLTSAVTPRLRALSSTARPVSQRKPSTGSHPGHPCFPNWSIPAQSSRL